MQGDSLLEWYDGVDLSHLVDADEQDVFMSGSWELKEDLAKSLKKYFGETNHAKKKVLKDHISETIKKILDVAGVTIPEGVDIAENNHFFLWHTWFNEVFAEGGFDIVIGNPPYVQIKWLSKKEQYAKAHFDTFDSTGDIYCLFYECGTRLLKEKGKGIFITSNKWLKSNYGIKLRNYFISKTCPELLIDLGSGVFETATVDTCILLWSNSSYDLATEVCSVDNIQSIASVHHENIRYELNDIWNIYSDKVVSIKHRIEKISTNLSNIGVQLEYGILTGANDAFILDEEKAHELIELDPRNEQLIKPILRGKDLGRYCAEFKGIYLLCVHNGVKKERIPPVDVEKDYPSLIPYFEQFGDKFKNRGEQGATYYNLRNCAYIMKYEAPKIIYADIVQDQGKFFYDTEKYYTNDTAFLITGDNLVYLVGVLNSKAFSFFYKQFYCGGALGNKGLRFKRDYLMRVPIPIGTESQQKEIVSLVTAILSQKKDNSFADTLDKETAIDRIVYRLYDLTEEDIKIIEEQESGNNRQ